MFVIKASLNAKLPLAPTGLTISFVVTPSNSILYLLAATEI